MSKKYSDNPQVNVRLPEALLNRLRIAADSSGRTLQAEIASRLENSFPFDEEESLRLREHYMRVLEADLELLRDKYARKREFMTQEQIAEAEAAITHTEKTLNELRTNYEETKAIYALANEAMKEPLAQLRKLAERGFKV